MARKKQEAPKKQTLSDQVKQQIDVFAAIHKVDDIGIFARMMLSIVGYPIVRSAYEHSDNKKEYIELMYAHYVQKQKEAYEK